MKKVLKVLEEYELVDIQREDIFKVMRKVRDEIGMNFEQMGQDLVNIEAIDSQTELFIKMTSDNFKKLNENVNNLNIEESLTLIRNINEIIENLDKNKVSGKIIFHAIPQIIDIEAGAEVDASEVWDKIKNGLNKLKEHLMGK